MKTSFGPWARGVSRLQVLLLAGFLGCAADAQEPPTHYVDASNHNPVFPYASWATAATRIQDAVDAATAGALVLVTNGTYATGGRGTGPDLLLNRVAVEKPMTLRSVNGPSFTVIQGAKVGTDGNGEGAIRCVSLTDGATLSGFTLSNGGTRANGSIEREESGGGVWCASTNATVTNCVLTANSAAQYGGGAWSGTLDHCTLMGNSANDGGGTAGSALFDCALKGNKAFFHGGGALDGLARNSMFVGNSAEYGGGVATEPGSGRNGCILYNCILTGNSASRGGAVSGSSDPCVLYNCTITGNSASVYGGGVASEFYGAGGGLLANCIVYFNQPENYQDSTFTYSCTTPLPPGQGNTDVDPQLVSATRLSPVSPCVGAANAAAALGVDIDGEPWANPPAMGADQPSATSGEVGLSITVPVTTVAAGFVLSLTGDSTGHLSRSIWDFGDGERLTNRPFASHAWTAAGQYAVKFTGYNDTYAGGATTTATITVVDAPRYVNAASPHPVPPYESWESAAASLQDAVDVSPIPGTVVWVTNGVYATGGRTVGSGGGNRVVVSRPIILRSVNGPEVTTIRGNGIRGDGAIRCAYLEEGAILSGFTLENGAALPGDTDAEGGGGVWCASTNALVTNCILVGNWAIHGGGAYRGLLKNCILTGNSAGSEGGGDGGGVYESDVWDCTFTGNTANTGGASAYSVLHNCTVTGNSAQFYGGGTYATTLYNCTVTGNSATAEGGGTWYCSAFNSIVYHNQAASGNNYLNTGLQYSCATPLPEGAGNIDADPQLLTATHLASNSPCVRAGSRSYAAGVDIDGEPWSDPPAMGADEPNAATAAGPLTLQIDAPVRAFATGYAAPLTGLNTGRIQQSVWDFGDGTTLTNQAFVRHAWTVPGDYTVRLTGYNKTVPGGVTTFIIVTVSDQVRYVNASNPAPVSPFTSWESAAANIQDAVDAAWAGTTVLVSNGVYRAGGMVANGVSNRVVLTKSVIVRSVNGPSVTVIEGDTNGVRGGNESVLCGFTLTHGTASDGGGVLSEKSGVITNCVLSGNAADNGGGVSGGLLYDCSLMGNSATASGGGASGGALYRCLLSGNLCSGNGGGAEGSMLYNCTLAGNTVQNDGGGAHAGTLYGCVLAENAAFGNGGGASGSTFHNCTLVRNSAASGGGAISSTFYNSIVYFNRAHLGSNYLDATLEYSCTTPLPAGPGNIDADPLLVTAGHLFPDSPCVGTGNPATANGTDIDGESWANPPAMGADQPGAAGPLTIWIEAEAPAVVPGAELALTAWNAGLAQKIVWDFGDGTMLTNQPFAHHSWAGPGVYSVRLTAYNDAFPGGISASATIAVRAATLYVDQFSPQPAFPYEQWETAAATLQEAVDAAAVGATVLVTNGVYTAGLRAAPAGKNNRVVLDKKVTVRSVNGPQVTAIDGLGETRCAYIANGAVLSGFTLTNGAAGDMSAAGGGVWSEPFGIVTNCVLIGNGAFRAGGAYGGMLYNCRLKDNWAAFNGGAASSVLYNCLVISNTAGGYFRAGGSGGGAGGCTLYNCTVAGNSASWGGPPDGPSYGGGAANCALTNCIVIFNSASSAEAANYDPTCALDHSCATPFAPGLGNIDAYPLFANAGAGDFHLRYGSPCIDSGAGLLDLINTDFEGHARPLPGHGSGPAAFDMGAYEFDLGSVEAFLRPAVVDANLVLSWNDRAKGMTLQRATRLTNPDWRDVPGSDATTGLTLPMETSIGFFRLVRR